MTSSMVLFLIDETKRKKTGLRLLMFSPEMLSKELFVFFCSVFKNCITHYMVTIIGHGGFVMHVKNRPFTVEKKRQTESRLEEMKKDRKLVRKKEGKKEGRKKENISLINHKLWFKQILSLSEQNRI
jgi:hypothetical protein